MERLNAWIGAHGAQALMAWLLAFTAAAALTPVVIKIARAKGLVARPSADRWHRTPTALFGGVAIFGAAMVAAFVHLPLSGEFRGVALGGALIFAVGLYDDRYPLKPSTKFIAQLVAACLFTAVFYNTYPPELPWLVPFAMLWIAGITNAFNLLDNMDGLSAGVATIVSLMMATHAAMMGDTGVALCALVLAGASGGFLVYNFNPAKIFMGDCGSMFLGYTLACLSLMGSSGLLSGNLFTALLLPTLVLATPLFDTIFVSVNRILHGRPISQGGRDHTSHRLVLLGLSERRAVFYLYGITLWFGLIALWGAQYRDLWGTLSITVLSLAALLVFGQFLGEVQTYSDEEYEKARHRVLKQGGTTALSRVIMHKRRFAEALLDFGLICACYTGAFLLKFDGVLDGETSRVIALTLPYAAACQMMAFAGAGLYRGLWRYATISDLGNLLRGVLLGTLAWSLLIWWLRPVEWFPRSTPFTYATLLLVTAGGMRLGLKALRYHFALNHGEAGRRVLVVGAGDAGELAVREMINNKSLQLMPVGFVDDDPQKHRASIHGVRVLGSRSQLLPLIEQLKIDEVVIAMPSVGNGVVNDVMQICERQGIQYREVRGVIL
jgi:UDP-GlcNAc:undecaprenyl-phosphate/decaprenyl-phosphate GlcNAc-1-phosphate transferase